MYAVCLNQFFPLCALCAALCAAICIQQQVSYLVWTCMNTATNSNMYEYQQISFSHWISLHMYTATSQLSCALCAAICAICPCTNQLYYVFEVVLIANQYESVQLNNSNWTEICVWINYLFIIAIMQHQHGNNNLDSYWFNGKIIQSKQIKSLQF